MVQQPGTWAGLKHDASQDLLYFDPAAAVTGAEAARRMVDQMLAMRAAIDDFYMDELSNVTGGVLTSGQKLAEIYNKRADRLSTVLQDHANIGTEMANAFVQAGLYYRRTEEQNSAELDKLAEFSVPVEPSAEIPSLFTGETRYDDLDYPDGEWRDAGRPGTQDDYRYTPAAGVPGELQNYIGRQESISPDAVQLENSSALGFRHFRDLADKMPWGIFVLAAISRRWWQLASHTKAELERFESAIEGIQDKWLGHAADRARTATRNYVDSIAPLWNSMYSMSENMHYSAEWLNRTWMSMPGEDFTFDSASVEQAVLQRYREEWEKHYAEGMRNSLREMPVIEGPIAEPGPPPANDDNNQNHNNQNNNSGGGNNGGGPGNQSPEDKAYEKGYDEGYDQGFEDGRSEGGQNGQGGGPGEGHNGGSGSGQGDSSGSGQGQGHGQGQGQGHGEGQGQGQGEGQGHGEGGQSGGSGRAPEVPSYDRAEYGSGQTAPGPGSTGGSDGTGGTTTPVVPSVPAADAPGQNAPGESIPVPGSTMPKNPTAADILAKLTGIPRSLLPDALKNIPITGKDGKPPTLADALSKITGIPVDQMPSELHDTPLESLYEQDSPYGAVESLFGAFGADITPAGDPEGKADPESAIATLLGGTPETTGSGSVPGQQHNILDRLTNMLTQGIQAFTQAGGSLPGLDQLQHLLDPSALQQHVAQLLDPARSLEPAAGLGGGIGGGLSGGPGAPVPETEPLAPYPGTKPSPFPRASLAAPGLELAGYSGISAAPGPTGGTPGMPMMGAPAAGAGSSGAPGQSNGHAPAEFLVSRENLDEVFDESPAKVRPVIEQ
ncbi:hypothetical protein IU448_17735 [Nocardia flavorosea]|uniref:hypothetical protein n=1 Tax=Nocardia flavorosea TaxID=53429 RepID=UPI001895E976|nr:hypothetical protein [Nocardia flavorosea]MBF6350844.1 hypothetical protein [Nocardia flavorosea]